MKVIDLLNEISKDNSKKELKIGHIDDREIFENFSDFVDRYVIENVLNDEIEIIEEDKQIEKLDGLYLVDDDEIKNALNENNHEFFAIKSTRHNEDILNKTNELIEEVNKLKKEGN